MIDTGISNLKCGIDVLFSGGNGTGFMEEYFFYNKPVCDRKVTYIRDDTLITMQHNALNQGRNSSDGAYVIYGANGPSQIANSGGSGIIRYKIDRDMQWSGDFSGSGPGVFPAYSGAFTFNSLQYAPGVPVVGTTGSNGVILTEATKGAHYWRGMQDAFGDEWHTIQVSDDDGWSTTDSEWRASDAKVRHFVVNPKTPCLAIYTTGDAQFYTTPAKKYFVPYIYSQTTYFATGTTGLQGTVFFELKDIYDNDIFYRINSGGWNTAKNPILTQNDFQTGQNTLDYYYQTGYVKTRNLVKNPTYPSSGEVHGDLLWGPSGWNAVRSGILSGTAPIKDWYDSLRTASFFNKLSVLNGSGGLYSGTQTVYQNSIQYAIFAKLSNWTGLAYHQTKTNAYYAWGQAFDNATSIDNVGIEKNHSATTLPTRNIIYRGYYDMNTLTDLALGYDILINEYKSYQYTGGITPIQDYYVRDCIGRFVSDQILFGYSWNNNLAFPDGGMWDTSRKIACLAGALAIPTYSTEYFGTCGLDGNTGLPRVWSPFPTGCFTWKKLLIDNNAPLSDFPEIDRRYGRFGVEEYLITPSGNFGDRISYYSMPLVGHCLGITANLAKINLSGYTYPNLEKSFIKAAEGSLSGSKFINAGDYGTRQYSNLIMMNSRFPDAATIGHGWITPTIADDGMKETAIYGLIWYDPSFVATVAAPVISPTGGSFVTPQPVTISTTTPNAGLYYTINGTVPSTGSILYTGAFTVNSTLTVSAIGALSGYNNSAITNAPFVFGSSQVAPPIFSPNGGAQDTTFLVSISTATPSASIYYTTNGSDPTQASTLYTTPIPVSVSTTLRARAFLGGSSDSIIQEAYFGLITSSPSIAPSGGSFANPPTVTISTPTTGATIYYTLNDTAPTTGSTVYNGPFAIATTQRLRAIADTPALDASNETSVFFNIADFIATEEWQNYSFPRQDGIFICNFSLEANTASTNGIVGLSFEDTDDLEDVACSVRLANNGRIEVLNGDDYTYDVIYPYEAELFYNVSMRVNINTHTYSVTVQSSNGGPLVQLATNYSFRPIQSLIGALNRIAFIVLDPGVYFSISAINMVINMRPKRLGQRIKIHALGGEII